MTDIQYQKLPYQINQQEHKYGDKIHIISDPVLMSLLARLCDKTTFQPAINDLIRHIYRSMVRIVINMEFPRKTAKIDTRMVEFHPNTGVYEGEIIDPDTKVVIVDLARAGMLPSMVCYEYLLNVMNPRFIRQDHIFINRMINDKDQVVGTNLSGHKIGGAVDRSFVLLPDPMGATGNSIGDAINVYKTGIEGTAKKFIAIHLIITPEYIQTVSATHPDLTVYAVRLDRGLSSQEILNTTPGTDIKNERGLNDKDYIVPGGGGFGEVINNSFV